MRLFLSSCIESIVVWPLMCRHCSAAYSIIVQSASLIAWRRTSLTCQTGSLFGFNSLSTLLAIDSSSSLLLHSSLLNCAHLLPLFCVAPSPGVAAAAIKQKLGLFWKHLTNRLFHVRPQFPINWGLTAFLNNVEQSSFCDNLVDKPSKCTNNGRHRKNQC